MFGYIQRFDRLGLQAVEIIIFVKILLKISESNSRLKGFWALGALYFWSGGLRFLLLLFSTLEAT